MFSIGLIYISQVSNNNRMIAIVRASENPNISTNTCRMWKITTFTLIWSIRTQCFCSLVVCCGSTQKNFIFASKTKIRYVHFYVKIYYHKKCIKFFTVHFQCRIVSIAVSRSKIKCVTLTASPLFNVLRKTENILLFQ